MNKLLVLAALLVLVNFAYAQDYSLASGDFYEIKEGQERIDFREYNGTYTICEHENKTIPVLIANNAAAGDKYSLIVGGADFAGLSVSEFTLQKKQSGIVFVELYPKENTRGKYAVVIASTSSAGSTRELVLDLNVERCRSIGIELETEYDKICGGEKKEYSGEVTNEGKEKIDADIEINGPDWAAVDRDAVSVNPGAKGEFSIYIEPVENEAGTFYFNLVSMIRQFPSIKSEKTLKLDVVPKYECYRAEVLFDDKIRSGYSASYTPIKVRNIGIRSAEYGISLEGPEWVQIEPRGIKVNPGQQGNVNLILNPAANISEGTYPVKINAELDGITYSKSIEIVLAKDRLNGIKYFFAFYKYYIYLAALIILVLLAFRNKIRRSYVNYRLRKARLKAIELARNRK